MNPGGGPDSRLISAWQQAAIELQVRVVAPFDIRTSDGRSYQMVAYLPDFGEADGAGLIVFDADIYPWPQMQALNVLSDTLGYELVGIYTAGFAPFNRAKFAEFLRDQDWIGPGGAPAWHVIGRDAQAPGSA
jgi:hypothetical protein